MGRTKAAATSSPGAAAAAAGPSGPPIQVIHSKGSDGTYSFSEKLHITSNVDNRSFSLALIQDGVMGHVLTVQTEIEEKVEGKGSVKITFGAVTDQANGATWGMSSKFTGAVEVEKGRISSPPLPDTEFLTYDFGDSMSPSFFIVEKKSNAESVERITAAHCFPISEEEFYYVVVKITASNRGEGLCVKVEDPVMKTLDFVANLWEKFLGKVGRKMNQRLLSGSGDKNMKQLNQSPVSYVNTGMQVMNGFINSSGFMTGTGNGSFYHKCIFSRLNK